MTSRPWVLGVDPSFNRTGWALLSFDCRLLASGVVKPKGDERSDRLISILQQFRAIICEHRPDFAYLEQPGAWQRRGGSRRETIEAMGMARGVMLAAFAETHVPATEVHFRVARQATIGSACRREDVVPFVHKSGLEIPRRPRGGVDFDVANAILMAIYGIGQRSSR